MTPKLNRHLLTRRVFDSGALSILASVAHRFPRPGRYEAVARRDDLVVGTVAWEVAEGSPSTQLDVDLSALARVDEVGRGCGCGPKAAQLPTLSPEGYVIFFVGAAIGGYSVVVGAVGEDAVLFDSTRLERGDLFALSLLEPARYVMVNRLGSAEGSIEVGFSTEQARLLRQTPPSYVEVGRDRFEPGKVALASAQGLVFRVLEPARIVVEREQVTQRPSAPDSGPVRIRPRRAPVGRPG
jgi:hypothetical protein